MMIDKVLIANRGEIALRILHTCKALGIQTVAVYSDEDKNSLHVKHATESYHIGEGAPSKSYLNQEKIIEAAIKSGADSVHPGYGFLSENSVFAKLCEKNKIKFIGPPSKSIELCGDKMRCKAVMLDACSNSSWKSGSSKSLCKNHPRLQSCADASHQKSAPTCRALP